MGQEGVGGEGNGRGKGRVGEENGRRKGKGRGGEEFIPQCSLAVDATDFEQLESAGKVGDYAADVSLCSQHSAAVRQHACIGEVRGLS